ncbi:hypothetical protein Lesp02_70400 [Lentzea sp. NBRC 105346]|uniref:hypothetical protein n=1 Tax=Lentzea sp. NBRC 105346 TaxID=3032205 RepID=UPI0024A08C3B|nr:hypothetical protein [Lentzea sp. NBRC 105346]GLZ34853.1 hypothetical protein Lesp02_70400 [Lentzea sp. NBRC 105346]
MTLSYRAAGLLAHLRTLPPGPIRTAELARPEHREGRDAVRATLRELAAAGHVETRRQQDDTGHWRTETHLVTPETEKPGPATTVDTNPQVQPETENPAPDQPKPGKPFPVQSEFPQVTPETDSPAPEKPVPSTCTPVGSTSSSTSVVNNSQSDASRPPARARTRERVSAAQLAATASKPEAWRLVAAWADTLDEPILTPDRRELAKHVDTLLAQGATLPTLRVALDLWATQGRTPNYLPHAYREASRAARQAASDERGAVDVPGSRVRGRDSAPRSARGEKVRGWLAVDDEQPEPGAFLRMIEGGKRDAG